MKKSLCLMACAQALAACAPQTEPIAAVQSVEQHATFVAGITDANMLQPKTIDLCWVDDDSRTLSDADYQAQKDHFQELFEDWRVNTGLSFNWRASCRAPATDALGRDDFVQDEIRIYLDDFPKRGQNDVLPGRNCASSDSLGNPIHRFGTANWSAFPQDRFDTSNLGGRYCAMNMRLHTQFNDWEPDATYLHEMGHALGLLHEHARIDTPDDCRNYSGGTQLAEGPGAPLPVAIPDGNVNGVRRALNAGVLVGAANSVSSIRVYSNLTHALPAQLRVSLIAPDGTEVFLHNRSTASPTRIWDSSSSAALAGLIGKTVSGNWRFVVRDDVAGTTGQITAWRIAINAVAEQNDGIYSSARDEDSVMHYGPSPFTCDAPGNYTHIGLSDADHLAVEMAYPNGELPVLGEGLYRDDMPITLRSGWVARGARAGDELNEGFLSNFAWGLRNSAGTSVASATSTELSVSARSAGTYTTSFQVDDYWGRTSGHTGKVVVMTPAAHTGLLAAFLL
jgi:subtilisin-like proprotein convertase family protein